MREIFEKHGINLSFEQEKKFEIYKNLLIKYNEMYNITAITEEKEIYKKHFLDSCIGYEKIEGNTLIDIGSGGGFPALPLKIMRDDLNVTLVEATLKKCNFLEEVIKNLNLSDCKVINGRAEDLAFDKNFREKFDICSARAVARLNILCEYCLPFVKKGGQFISYKGNSKEEILEAQDAVKILGGNIKNVDNFSLFDENRSIIYIEKIKNTDVKYPRKNALIRKKPL